MTPENMTRKRQKANMTPQGLADAISKTVFEGKKKLSGRTISYMESGRHGVQWYVEKYFKEYPNKG
jgi:hypothetical protein